MAQSAMPSMAGYDTGYAGAGYGAPSSAQYGSPGATAAYGQAYAGQAGQFHDYRGTGGMAPYQPAARERETMAPYQPSSSASAAYGGYSAGAYGADTGAAAGSFSGAGAGGQQYATAYGQQYGAAAPAPGSFTAAAPGSFTAAAPGSFTAAGYGSYPAAGSFGAYGADAGYPAAGSFGTSAATNPLPHSGSFVASGPGFDTGGLPGMGPMGQFSNPFLAAMYSTLNGQTDPKNWPQFDAPAPDMPLAAAVAARQDAKFNAGDRAFERAHMDGHARAEETGADLADADRKKILHPGEKEEKKKRGKKEKEQPSGFWFWTCS